VTFCWPRAKNILNGNRFKQNRHNPVMLETSLPLTLSPGCLRDEAWAAFFWRRWP
jgi:hypothetical protein